MGKRRKRGSYREQILLYAITRDKVGDQTRILQPSGLAKSRTVFVQCPYC